MFDPFWISPRTFAASREVEKALSPPAALEQGHEALRKEVRVLRTHKLGGTLTELQESVLRRGVRCRVSESIRRHAAKGSGTNAAPALSATAIIANPSQNDPSSL